MASSVSSSSAAAVYSALSELQPAAAASNGPGPGPLRSNAECTSGGSAIHSGAIHPGAGGEVIAVPWRD